MPRCPGLVVLACALAAASCGQSRSPLGGDASAAPCVGAFQPGEDSFPDKAQLRHAELFRVTYHGSYKLLDIDAAGAPGGLAKYLLLQCGAPDPGGFGDRVRIEVPARRLAVTHTYLQEALVLLDAVDHLVAVQSTKYAAAPPIRAAIESGKIVAVGAGHHTDVELITALEPDAVVVYEPFFSESNRLVELGIPVLPSSESREPSMRGATEWMMLVAILLNREADMARILEETYARYDALAARVADVEERPTFIVGRPYRGEWYLPGGKANWAQQIEDAGGRYLFHEDTTSENRGRDLEEVLARAGEVDVWIGAANANSIDEILADEPRLSSLRAVARGAVWSSDAARTADGYNPYWEHRLPYPDRLLADLIAILHPERLPGHQLNYFRRLPKTQGVNE